MTYTIDPILAAIAIVALVLGLIIGLALRGGLKRRVAVLDERNTGLARERDAALVDRDRLATELKAREAQIRPLSDEVDKLRRDFARAAAARANPESLGSGVATAAALPAGVAAEARAINPLDLAHLKGVGAKFADKLRAAGITRIDQIAGWNSADVEVIDGQMGEFRGRIAGDRLVEQAQLLTQGRYTEYETVFGKLGPA
jgi:predicted flap endonuclease-1-like 5' DNA nuclease